MYKLVISPVTKELIWKPLRTNNVASDRSEILSEPSLISLFGPSCEHLGHFLLFGHFDIFMPFDQFGNSSVKFRHSVLPAQGGFITGVKFFDRSLSFLLSCVKCGCTLTFLFFCGIKLPFIKWRHLINISILALSLLMSICFLHNGISPGFF